jgi:transcriptional regulator with XRE-family HTH domain
MNPYRPAKKRIVVSVGESVRIIRELQGLSQNRLAELSGIPQATFRRLKISASVSVLSGRRYWRAPCAAIQPC